MERRFGLADLLLIIVAVIWGFNVVAVKLALGTLTPLTFNALRFLGAALVSWLLLSISRQGLLPLKADWRRIGSLGLLGHGVYQVMFILGTNLTSAGNTALLLATIPVWVAALTALKEPEPVPPLTWLGIGLSVTGIVLVTLGAGRQVGIGADSLVGDLLLLGGTFFYAWYTVGSKHLLAHYTPLQFSAWTMTVGAGALLVISSGDILRQNWAGVESWGWGGLIYSTLLAIVVGYYIWNKGVKQLGPARTALYNNLSPVTAMLSGWLLMGENLTLVRITGAALIIGGLYIARFVGLRREKVSPGEGFSQPGVEVTEG